MKFAVIPNMTRPAAKKVTEDFLEEVCLLNCEAFLDVSLQKDFGTSETVTYLPDEAALSECDTVVAIGGDGTFINAAKRAAAVHKPLLCINAGKLAFLAGLEPDEMGLLKNVTENHYRIERRMLLEAQIIDKTGEILYHANCVNDAVVSRSGNIRITKLSVLCDGRKLIDYFADGVILATPTGSTAYSLSAGGPVVEPQVESILLTPVCCHTVFSRPVLFGDGAVLDVYHDNTGEVILSCDGNAPATVPKDAAVRVFRAKETMELIKVKDDNFLDVLSKKMA